MKNKQKDLNNSRRDFLKKSSIAFLGVSILPSHVISGLGHIAPSDKLNVAGIGVGGMGRNNLKNIKNQNIVALCDVDWGYAKRCFDDYPDIKKYKDYRIMLDEMEKQIDAVVIATPDHSHYISAANSMKRGMHVYVQKPLTHSVWESRELTKLANQTGVATQMGNQGNSSDDIRKVCEWIWNGEIGEVKNVEAWTNRPIWPQGLERPTNSVPIPETLDWDLFIGPAPYRPYHPSYTPWNWRAWWDFGTGALGDMGCHIIDPVFKALDLGFPYAFEGSSSQVNTESAPISEMVTYYFNKRPNKGKIKMPKVKFTWFDGGHKPERPKGMKPGTNLGNWGGGAIFHGTKGTLVCGTYAMDPIIIGREDNPPAVTNELRRVETSHEMDWIRACKENKRSRIEASSNFSYSGPLNEVVVMGNLAIRLQDLKRRLEWDAENMRITNISDSDEIRVVTTDKFDVVDGDPKWDTRSTTINAKEAASEYVKRSYRNGWYY